jgi:hypothetical protein
MMSAFSMLHAINLFDADTSTIEHENKNRFYRSFEIDKRRVDMAFLFYCLLQPSASDRFEIFHAAKEFSNAIENKIQKNFSDR